MCALTFMNQIQIFLYKNFAYQLYEGGSLTKTEISRKFSIPNSTLSTVVKNRDKIIKNYETKIWVSKQLRTVSFENLLEALMVEKNQLYIMQVCSNIYYVITYNTVYLSNVIVISNFRPLT